MTEPGAFDFPAYAQALRQELLIAAQHSTISSSASSIEVWRLAECLSAPWWTVDLDGSHRQAVIHRIAVTLINALGENTSLLETMKSEVGRTRITSVSRYWTRSILARALFLVIPYDEVISLLVSDALMMARMEVAPLKFPYVIDLADIYDTMALTSALARLHSLAKGSGTKTLIRAREILLHALLIGDRHASSSRD